MNRRVLYLTLFREYFDAILRGEKTTEYREMTEFWERRLEGRTYDVVVFRNGYKPLAEVPEITIAYRGLDIEQRPDGAIRYAIRLGRILSTRNC